MSVPQTQSSAQGSSKFADFLQKLEDGLHNGLPTEVRAALESVKNLDHKKDCLYNTINRQVKHFFLQHPKPRYTF